MSCESPRIEKSIYIEAPPEVVFGFLTDPEKMVRWCGEEAELQPQPGGLFKIRFEGGVVSEGRYLIVDPPRRVVFTVGMSVSAVPAGGSRVEIHLIPEGEGTRLNLRHDGFDPSQPVSEGWDHHLSRLKRAALGEALGSDASWRIQPKGLSENKWRNYRAPIWVRFALLRWSKTGGIAGPILRILRLRTGRRWPEGEMRECAPCFRAGSNCRRRPKQ